MARRWTPTAGGRAIACFLAVLASVTATQAEVPSLFDPATGYRIDRYRTPVTADLRAGKRITLDGLDQLVAKERAVLIDVMAVEGGGLDPETGQWRISKPHHTIPGAIWLPDVGRGQIDAALDGYFQDQLKQQTGGDKARAVIIFCMADCWMSWNAVHRAAGYGYTAVYWYAEGVDGWIEWDDRNLVPASALPLSPSK